MNRISKNNEKSKSFPIKRLLFCNILIIICFLTFIILYRFGNKTPEWQADLDRLYTEDYQCIALSMFSAFYFYEDDFEYYRALTTVKADYEFQSLKEISTFLEDGFLDSGTISTIYLGLDPVKIGESNHYDSDGYTKALNSHLLPLMERYPDINFEVLLSYPSLNWWQSLKETQILSVQQTYLDLVSAMETLPNIKIFYPGHMEWLIANPGNYETDRICNPDVSRLIILFSFSDPQYQVDTLTMAEHLSQLNTLIDEADVSRNRDYSDYSFVFFGDSIIGNYAGSLSIPGVVQAYTDARVYNCGYGGLSASEKEPGSISFPALADAFLTGDYLSIPQDKSAHTGIMEYGLSEAPDTDKLCFIINFGFNDYFSGSPVENDDLYDKTTYAGALRTGIRNLQTAYPEAEIILMTPTYTSYFSEGTEQVGDAGGILVDYVAAAVSIAEEFSIHLKNNYADSGIHAENHGLYLSDGCHPNEAGRYMLGRQIVELLHQIYGNSSA